MKRSTISCFFVVLTLLVSLSVSAQNLAARAALNQPTELATDLNSNSTGAAASNAYQQPRLIGFFSAEGKYQPAHIASNGEALELPDTVPNPLVTPRFAKIGSDEAVVENFAPPAHASQGTKGPSLMATLRDNLITWAYGHARVMQNPTHVVTDSHGRLIVADPQLRAVHVLDPAGKMSFRISGGTSRRLQSPGSVAVDAQDQIYIADPSLHLISVYDPEGRFLRYIGEYGGETMFDTPGAIAIDKQAGRLYVLDTPADELVVMNLEGKVLRRAGNRRARAGLILVHPSEIALWKDQIYVLDMFGARIQILDADLKQVASFQVRSENEPPLAREVGMALDHQGNLYLSNLVFSRVMVYSHQGQFVAVVGKQNPGRNYLPTSGIWVDTNDRLFVCDSSHGRVQIFQIGSSAPPAPAARD